MSKERLPSPPSAQAGDTPDLWDVLRRATAARIGLGRAGDAIPVQAVLAFQEAHAAARDAVYATLDADALAADLAPLSTLAVASQATERPIYLRRPDLGRLLAPASAAKLRGMPEQGYDIVFVIADGLSATAVRRHAVPMIRAAMEALSGFRFAPVIIAHQARVAIADPIGEALGARLSVIMIGERPGLTVSDSLGLYLTYDPRSGRRDSERNCISNVHDHGGQTYAQAARTLSWLAREALRRSLSGVDLKDTLPSESLDAVADTPRLSDRKQDKTE
ncbi:MAG: ethanolamine ammonia-lyase subunit EutC [Sphingobium sp.]